ncbi:cytidine deaminase [Corynebacterium sphenisci DSM 44792]|uniref:Cytidine deaminase n=1 Tax=Corynebacterium sphenisci DSM 44792 TaxID=1437874 RepID=A0A1L7CWS2_9CORY|nr:cytidine deaminase [Corynebacterium sphenisci]APT90303.1 cytidine deaminase [Corynebacterium sphenisci DSM 44792]
MAVTDADLLALAHRAARNSYSPYSGFPVGAALLTEAGETITAANVENASYGLTNCAERSAVFRMVAEAGPGARVVACAIAGPGAAPLPPCGACRQVLHEFGCTRVVLEDDAGDPLVLDLADLLPHAFGPGDL